MIEVRRFPITSAMEKAGEDVLSKAFGHKTDIVKRVYWAMRMAEDRDDCEKPKDPYENPSEWVAALHAPEAPNRQNDWVGGRQITLERLFDEIYALTRRVTELENSYCKSDPKGYRQ